MIKTEINYVFTGGGRGGFRDSNNNGIHVYTHSSCIKFKFKLVRSMMCFVIFGYQMFFCLDCFADGDDDGGDGEGFFILSFLQS